MTGARELHDQLIIRYSPLVKWVAGRVSVGLPQTIEQRDLVSYGIFGLIDAIEKFDRERVSSSRPMVVRIKGAMIDELRNIDWAPRSVRALEGQGNPEDLLRTGNTVASHADRRRSRCRARAL